MGKIRTLNEIQLQKEILRNNLKGAEKNILNKSQSLAISFGSSIVTPILEKGLYTIINYFLKDKKEKHDVKETDNTKETE